jgi:hypothetical protein
LAGRASRVQERKQHNTSSLVVEVISNAADGEGIVRSMSESALLPNELRVSLQKIDHAHELISLIVGIKKKLVVAEWTAT